MTKVTNVKNNRTDAELVLVECKPIEALLIELSATAYPESKTLAVYNHKLIYGGKNRYFKPILISREDRIYRDDLDYRLFYWGYNETHGLVKVTNLLWAHQEGLFKVLSLPEHFSPEHLQMIVDGKLKEGKCLVECELINANSFGSPVPSGSYDSGNFINRIKLNSSNHVTIYPVEETCPTCGKDGKFCSDSFHKEEKMYSSEQLRRYLIWCVAQIAADFNLTPRAEDMKRINDATNRWFEQNVK